MSEIIANFSNAPFIAAVKSASVGDEIEEKFGTLKVLAIFSKPGTYEERLSPTVLFKRSFKDGVLLKKLGSTNFIHVPGKYLV